MTSPVSAPLLQRNSVALGRSIQAEGTALSPHGAVAQLVEQRARNPKIADSNPRLLRGAPLSMVDGRGR